MEEAICKLFKIVNSPSKMKISGTDFRQFIIGFYQIIISSGFVLVLLILGLFTLTKVEQTNNILSQYMVDEDWTWQLTFLYLAVFLWCYILQACLNITLFNATNIDKNEISKKTAKWLPFIVAQAPIIALSAILKSYEERWVLPVLIVTYAALFFIPNLVVLNKQDTEWVSKLWKSSHSVVYDFRRLWESWQYRYFFYFTAVLIIFCAVVFIVIPVSAGIAVCIGPPAILVLGVCVLTIFFSLISFMSDPSRRPVFIFFFAYLWVVSFFNENKEIRKTVAVNQTLDADKDFENWVADRKSKGMADNDTLPVILVATEGGGIRAATHTILTLLQCNKQIPNFDHHLYAISGVSGGGIGATFYTAFRHDQQKNSSLTDNTLKELCHTDFVADVLGGLLFSDAFNSLLPVGSESLDRNKKLEDAWSAGYKNLVKTSTLDSGFTKLWASKETKRNYNLPALLLNGTLAETGQRIVTSNLSLDRDSRYFKDIKFTLERGGKDFPVKTAALLCARFPLVTSGGLLIDKNKMRVGHITDGGYFENTGLETLVHWLNLVSPRLSNIESKNKIKLKFHFLFLQNSTNQDSEGTDIETTNDTIQVQNETVKVVKKEAKKIAFPSFGTIFRSFLNPWNRGSITRNNLYRSMLNSRKDADIKYYHFQLKRYPKTSVKDYPLGWFLSEALVKQMDDSLKTDKTFMILKADISGK